MTESPDGPLEALLIVLWYSDTTEAKAFDDLEVTRRLVTVVQDESFARASRYRLTYPIVTSQLPDVAMGLLYSNARKGFQKVTTYQNAHLQQALFSGALSITQIKQHS